jgi:hypothetical protein
MKWLLRTAAALVLAMLPAPALAAAGDPELEPTWPTLWCTSGAIESTAVTPGFADGRIELAGYLDCARPSDSDAYYGFATYSGAALGLLTVSNMERYATAPPSRFSHTIPTHFFDLSESNICLVTDRDVRIACVKVRYDGQAVTVEPLPTDAPVVKRKVRVENDTGHPWPACGGCW